MWRNIWRQSYKHKKHTCIFLRQACQWTSAGDAENTKMQVFIKITLWHKSSDRNDMRRCTGRPAGLCVLSSRCLCRLQAVTCRHAHARTYTRGNAALGLQVEETWRFPAGRGHRCLPTHVYSKTCRHWCLSVHVCVCHCQCASHCCATTQSQQDCNCVTVLLHSFTIIVCEIYISLIRANL